MPIYRGFAAGTAVATRCHNMALISKYLLFAFLLSWIALFSSPAWGQHSRVKDHDGDAKADFAFYRPSTQTWSV
jgi:hypothetical protein